MWLKYMWIIIIQGNKFKVTLRLGWSWEERKEKRKGKKKSKEMENKMLPCVCLEISRKWYKKVNIKTYLSFLSFWFVKQWRKGKLKEKLMLFKKYIKKKKLGPNNIEKVMKVYLPFLIFMLLSTSVQIERITKTDPG